MKDFKKYFSGLERDFGFCNVNNGYHDPQTNKLKFDPGDYGWSKRGVSEKDYEDHLEGKRAIGITIILFCTMYILARSKIRCSLTSNPISRACYSNSIVR